LVGRSLVWAASSRERLPYLAKGCMFYFSAGGCRRLQVDMLEVLYTKRCQIRMSYEIRGEIGVQKFTA
jgi:hypothetical protein